MDAPLPIIDVSGLSSETPENWFRVAREPGAACRGPGFFYMSGHGVDPALLARVFEEAGRFFALGVEAKAALSMRRVGNNRGWFEVAEERLDPGARQPFRGENGWRELPGWRKVMMEYLAIGCALGRLLHRGFSLDLVSVRQRRVPRLAVAH